MTRPLFWLLPLALAFAGPQTPRDLQMPATPPAQAPRGTGVIAGVLATVDTGKPVRQARVTISSADPRVTKTVTTTDQGRFSFNELPAAQYTLSASKPGLLDAIYGQRRPGSGREGTPIQLAAGQRLENIALAIPRGGVITGTVIDEVGDPAFGIAVRALRYVIKGGVRTPVTAGTGMTDDRGIYRIPALLPGEYLVTAVTGNTAQADMMKVEEARMRAEEAAAMARAAGTQAAMDKATAIMADTRMLLDKAAAPADEPTEAYVPVYYPNTASPSAAAPITLDISEERGAVDLQLQRQPVGRITGTIISTDAAPPPTATLWLIDGSNVIPGVGTRITRTMPDGRFSFSGIPAGQYTLLATATIRQTDGPRPEFALLASVPKPEAERAMAAAMSTPVWARVDLSSAGRPLDGVTLTLQRGMTISGTVNVEGAATSPVNLGRLTLTAIPAMLPGVASVEGPSVMPVPIDAQGRFTIRGVIPGFYRVVPSIGVSGLNLKSAVFGGRDVLDLPLEVKPGEDVAGGVLTMSAKSTEISGMLQDSAGAPAPAFTIVVFAADSRYWTPQSRRVQAVRPATDGRYSIRTLPAGDYRMIAITDVEPGQWFDPAFLKQLLGPSMAISLGDGERRVQDLRIK